MDLTNLDIHGLIFRTNLALLRRRPEYALPTLLKTNADAAKAAAVSAAVRVPGIFLASACSPAASSSGDRPQVSHLNLQHA